MEILKKLYTNASSPAGFSGLENLYKEAKKLDSAITKAKVKQFLEGMRTYTLFKPRRVNYERSKIIPSGFMTDAQADLAGILMLLLLTIKHYFVL